MEHIGIWIAAGMFVLVLLPVFLNMRCLEKKHFEITEGTVNHDLSMREFWYFSENNALQLLQILENPGTFEDYAYYFDKEKMTLSFHNVLTEYTARCVLTLEPREDGTRIRLYWIEGRLPGMKVGIELILFENMFSKDVLDADPIPYKKREV